MSLASAMEPRIGPVPESGLEFARGALDPESAERAIGALFATRRPGFGRVTLEELRLMRFKPKRRCLIEYRLRIERANEPAHPLILLGKVRRRGADNRTEALSRSLRAAGLGDPTSDRVRVPEPYGVVEELGLWLQERVPGVAATDALEGPEGVTMARRAAHALVRLHSIRVPCERSHTREDELAILEERYDRLGRRRPELRSRLDRLFSACERAARALPDPRPSGIHRDFYADQLVVHGDDLWLVDLDLYARGDPAIDVGNFAAHLIEQGLRRFGDLEALTDRRDAFVEGYLEARPEVPARSIETYENLALARHVSISSELEGRGHETPALLELCERRFQLDPSC